MRQDEETDRARSLYKIYTKQSPRNIRLYIPLFVSLSFLARAACLLLTCYITPMTLLRCLCISCAYRLARIVGLRWCVHVYLHVIVVWITSHTRIYQHSLSAPFRPHFASPDNSQANTQCMIVDVNFTCSSTIYINSTIYIYCLLLDLLFSRSRLKRSRASAHFSPTVASLTPCHRASMLWIKCIIAQFYPHHTQWIHWSIMLGATAAHELFKYITHAWHASTSTSIQTATTIPLADTESKALLGHAIFNDAVPPWRCGEIASREKSMSDVFRTFVMWWRENVPWKIYTHITI